MSISDIKSGILAEIEESQQAQALIPPQKIQVRNISFPVIKLKTIKVTFIYTTGGRTSTMCGQRQ